MAQGIIIIVESYVRWIFFSRMQKAMEQLGVRLLYFTTCPSVYFSAKKAGADIKMLALNNTAFNGSMEPECYENTLDVKSGELSRASAQKVARSIYANLLAANKSMNADTLFIYNGTTILGAVATQFARDQGLKTLFFELANLPGKMFVDPEGIGGFSRLYRSTSILKNYTCNLKEFETWRRSFIAEKLNNSNVPQVVFGKSSMQDYLFYTGDKLYFAFLTKEPIKYILNYGDKFSKAFSKHVALQYDSSESFAHTSYIFFPMQVSHDSQILIHSNFDNFTAIKKAYSLSRKMGANLVVKPHPAETDREYLGKVYNLKRQLGFYLVSDNTIKLIQNAQAIITINSTVGLEAKIMKRNVYVLGRAIYANFDENMLASYVMKYLLNINYFSFDPISTDTACLLLERADIC
ncbi:capsule polysaccharide biosynthesis [Lucifera butyrica]|uniref:Capsule polysaccharide biosynthesis n=1 Tax=Lucifera butyrica TaxID=1351585 RepID=A0A498R581_9FIRM|nr:hypothetical protein [Lucifera butyrica]VBB05353.1 capsule polysaccharide biosynthesis [Lucifera butyrica]